MKTRIGFVSNSSSTSFCIYGIYLNASQLRDLLGDQICDYDDLQDEIRKIFPALYAYGDYEEQDAYIGKPWSDMKDDQTFGDFKEQVKAEIKAIMPDISDSKFDIYTEEVYN